MLIYIFLYMIGQQLNMGTTYWVLFWICLTARIVITFAKSMMQVRRLRFRRAPQGLCEKYCFFGTAHQFSKYSPGKSSFLVDYC